MSSALRPARSAARAICSRTRTSRSRICSAIARESYQRLSDGDKQTEIDAIEAGLTSMLKAHWCRVQNARMAGIKKREDLVVFIKQ
jgi:hypothetical protein